MPTTTPSPYRYTEPYVRRDGSVWCMATNDTTHGEIECRMVVDTDHPDLPFFWHASRKWDLTEAVPLGGLHRFCCPTWRWGTAADLAHWGRPADLAAPTLLGKAA